MRIPSCYSNPYSDFIVSSIYQSVRPVPPGLAMYRFRRIKYIVLISSLRKLSDQIQIKIRKLQNASIFIAIYYQNRVKKTPSGLHRATFLGTIRGLLTSGSALCFCLVTFRGFLWFQFVWLAAVPRSVHSIMW